MSIFKKTLYKLWAVADQYFQRAGYAILEKLLSPINSWSILGCLIKRDDIPAYKIEVSKDDKINLEGTFIAIRLGQPPKSSSDDSLSRS